MDAFKTSYLACFVHWFCIIMLYVEICQYEYVIYSYTTLLHQRISISLQSFVLTYFMKSYGVLCEIMAICAIMITFVNKLLNHQDNEK